MSKRRTYNLHNTGHIQQVVVKVHASDTLLYNTYSTEGICCSGAMKHFQIAQVLDNFTLRDEGEMYLKCLLDLQ